MPKFKNPFKTKTAPNVSGSVSQAQKQRTFIADNLEGDSAVSVTKKGLIALHRQGQGLSLKVAKLRATQGGQYLSPFKGRGMDFDEVRPYQPGDDMRTLDWRVMARTGKAHTKLFREERERSVLLWVDYRAPMFFATRGCFKSVWVARAAALLAWSAMQHGDRLGGLVFSEQAHLESRPQSGKNGVLHLIQNLVEHRAWQDSTVFVPSESGHASASRQASTEALRRLRRVSRPGSLLFLMSDFREFDAEAERQLAQLSRHNDVILLFVSDPIEQTLPPAGLYRMQYEGKEMTLDTGKAAFRADYAKRFLARKQHLEDLCRRYKLFFLPIETTEDPMTALRQGLGLRGARV